MLGSETVLLLGSQYERPALPSRAMVITWPKMLLMAMSGFMVQMQLGSVLMFIVCVTTVANVNHVKYRAVLSWLYPSLARGKLAPPPSPES